MTVLLDTTNLKPSDLRHPEKRRKPSAPMLRKPKWIRVRAPNSPVYHETTARIRKHKLTTVCEEATCPNIGECWSNRHATMMIMGAICTRACAFCNVRTGNPLPLDAQEPQRVANAVAELELQHVVITSVDRDDLEDGGALHFAHVISAIRSTSPSTTIEVLTPDFLRKKDEALEIVLEAKPDVFNHNIETVPRLYPTIRPGARYFHSLQLLDRVRKIDSTIFTKSGLMVGLGESREEVLQVMDDMRSAHINFLTVGQYLQPTTQHAPLKRFWEEKEFENLQKMAYAKGFLMASCSPLTRSSYHADRDFENLRKAREQQQGECL